MPTTVFARALAVSTGPEPGCAGVTSIVRGRFQCRHSRTHVTTAGGGKTHARTYSRTRADRTFSRTRRDPAARTFSLLPRLAPHTNPPPYSYSSAHDTASFGPVRSAGRNRLQPVPTAEDVFVASLRRLRESAAVGKRGRGGGGFFSLATFDRRPVIYSQGLCCWKYRRGIIERVAKK